RAALEISELPRQVPSILPAQFRRVQRRIALRLRAVARRAYRVERLARGGVAGRRRFRLGVGRIARKPRLESGFLFDDNLSPHREMCDAAELLAANVVGSGPTWR